jgi:hypothetical protein
MTNRMDQLYAQPKTRKVGGIEFKLHPLTMDDMGSLDIDEKAPPAEQVKKMKELISKVFKCTEEEVSKISMEFMMEMMNTIMEMHNIKSDKSNLLKDKLASVKKAKAALPTPNVKPNPTA